MTQILLTMSRDSANRFAPGVFTIIVAIIGLGILFVVVSIIRQRCGPYDQMDEKSTMKTNIFVVSFVIIWLCICVFVFLATIQQPVYTCANRPDEKTELTPVEDKIVIIPIRSVHVQNDIVGEGHGSIAFTMGSFDMVIDTNDMFVYYEIFPDGHIERKKIPFNFPIYEDSSTGEAYFTIRYKQTKIIHLQEKCDSNKDEKDRLAAQLKEQKPIQYDVVSEEIKTSDSFTVELHVPPAGVDQLR